MKKTVLLIDDEADFCYFLQKNLEASQEFKVFTANQGEEGLRVAKTCDPDIILLDVLMPGMSGSEVAEKLKAEESTRNIPVVFLTAIVQEQETRQENTIGGWHYVSKPVKIAELVKLINELVK